MIYTMHSTDFNTNYPSYQNIIFDTSINLANPFFHIKHNYQGISNNLGFPSGNSLSYSFNEYNLDFNKDEIKVGDRMKVIGNPIYCKSEIDILVAPEGSIGKVINIRYLNKGTPMEHKQYKLRFDGMPDGDSLTHLYDSFSLCRA